jgi:outer membrane lipoprotein SlyB
MRPATFAMILTFPALLAACATTEPPQQGAMMSTEGATLVQGGTVTNVRDVTVRGGGSGIGSIVGGILGGVAGSHIGGGTGSTVASIGGAVAGSMAGNQAEQTGVRSTATEVTVRLDSGEERNYRVEAGEAYRIGEPVKVVTSKGLARVTR